jgi:hypothetical protein
MRVFTALPEKKLKQFVFSKQTVFGKIAHLFKLFYYKKILGFDDVCTKPLDMVTLVAIIRKHLPPEKLQTIKNFNINGYDIYSSCNKDNRSDQKPKIIHKTTKE